MASHVAFCPSILDRDILSFDPTEICKPLPERAGQTGAGGSGRIADEADPVHERLRLGDERRGEEAARQRAEEDSSGYHRNQLTGSVKVKVDPRPSSLSTQIRPSCSSTNFFARVNPSPVPSNFRASSVPT